jgi:BolA protein
MTEKGPLILKLEEKMEATFNPQSLEIINESHLHSGHQPGFNGQGESHIRVRMVAEHFNGMSRVNIHRAVNEVCAEEIAAGLHALAIDVKGTG